MGTSKMIIAIGANHGRFRINILCLGARIVGPELAKDIIKAWLFSSFSDDEKHIRRLAKIKAIETEFLKARKTLKNVQEGSNT